MTSAEVATAVQLACLLEASAPKPGNVSPGKHFRDLRYEDFLASAAAIGAPFARVGDHGIGVTVREAIAATASWVPSNSNLGIVLLLAPLARAARLRLPDTSLRLAVHRVLAETTVDDSRDVFAAIRQAKPGGLGEADDQDVTGEPTLPLTQVMELAAGRDAIAGEYATDFATTFELSAPTLQRARAEGLSWDDAIVETFLTLLSKQIDTHIRRRAPLSVCIRVRALAKEALKAGGVRTAQGRAALASLDERLRGKTNLLNPGATADLTAAAIFVELLEPRG